MFILVQPGLSLSFISLASLTPSAYYVMRVCFSFVLSSLVYHYFFPFIQLMVASVNGLNTANARNCVEVVNKRDLDHATIPPLSMAVKIAMVMQWKHGIVTHKNAKVIIFEHFFLYENHDGVYLEQRNCTFCEYNMLFNGRLDRLEILISKSETQRVFISINVIIMT